MKRFKQFIMEGKNLHLTHAADFSFEGKERASQAIQFIESLTDMLQGSSKSKLNVTRKWDGAPAIFAGTNPENGKFFVGTKSIFNKTPKINYTNADISKNHGGGLADKLKIALKYLPTLGIKGVLQGDLLFGPGDISKDDIDGESYLTFTPNTITYAVQSGSDLAKRITKAKIGIVFHTKYTGKQMTNMRASFNVTNSDFGTSSTVWAEDARYKDLTGNVTFTLKEYAKMQSLINKAKLALKGAAKGSDFIASNQEIQLHINTYTNAKVRAGDYSFSVKEFISFVNEKLSKSVKSLKTEKARARKMKQINAIASRINSRSADINKVFKLNSALQQCVMMLVNKLQTVQSMRTFLKTSNGFKVTSDEGFVASDKVGNAVKLVNRLEFSRANFALAKNWVKG
jgi:hypothetical protein|tara:strand:+ start:1492 stop:2691 length:1200 start_codon:yes stop_codon:yes gene_type:complete